VADQLAVRRHVYPHETGVSYRRRGDAHVHFGGATRAQQLHQRPGRVAAHDRIVHQHDPLPLQILRQWIVLELHAHAPQLVVGLNESAADVAILGQPFCVGQA
jgi:hypothetical protein